MKVAITYYAGNPFAPGFPSKKTKEFKSLEKVKDEFKPESENVQVKARLLTAWLSIEDGDRQRECCWLEELLQGNGFHPFDDTQKVKAGEMVRVIGENGEWPINSPKEGIMLARDHSIPLQLFLHDIPDGKYFVIAQSGVTAWAEIKKPIREGEQRRFIFLSTSLDLN